MSASARTHPATSSEVAIRPACAGDLDALLALEHAAFAGDRADRRALRHAIRSPSMTLLAAIVPDADGRDLLVGAATIERRRTARVARLSSIAVAPNRAGSGLGRRLLAAAEAEALEHGCRRLRLEVRLDNGAGIRLYENAGYRRYATKPDYYEDGTSAWCYEKSLA